MLLSSFSYKESKWELTNLTLASSSCLIVGRNSTGKTRTIHALVKCGVIYADETDIVRR